MRDHSECEREIHEAMSQGKPGLVEWLATRCDRTHGRLAAAEGTERVAPVRAELAAARSESEEQP